jgi:small subunit ribosomal protein S4
MRALGVVLPGLSRKSSERRPYPPGQHGASRRRKISNFGQQLAEKQKIRYNYGLSEKPLRRIVSEAFRSRGVYSEKLVELLERRLDNVVFRAGFAPTIPAARQLVNHGHITVDGKKVTIPSFRVGVGHEVQVKAKSQQLPLVVSTLEAPPLVRPAWMEFDEGKNVAKMQSLPAPDSMPFPVNLGDVIEYYSRRVSK